jgi:hypothetical protein
LVDVRVYVVVLVGVASVLEFVAFAKPVVGVHAYVTPATGAIPTVNPPGFCVHVMIPSGPALARGTVRFTVTTTWSVDVHPLAVFVAVKVYVVVAVGLAVGFAILAADSPVVGVQE